MERTLNFEVKGKQYTIQIPTVGQLINIERDKSLLSGGNYSSMLNTNTYTAVTALDLIDAQAYLGNLCPEFMADLKTKSLMQLDVMDAREFLGIYRSQIAPWILEIQKLFKQDLSTNIDEQVTK